MKKSFIFIAIFSAISLGCSSNSSESTNESTCQVHFVNYDGTLLYKTTVTKGGDVSYFGDIPTKPSTTSNYYRFEGWDGSLYNIKEDVTLTATYEKMDQILVDENGIKYSPLSETEYYISGYEETHASHLIIGDTFNSFPVVKIGAGAFANNTDITTVTIRNGINHVGQKAFSNCINLVSFTHGDIFDEHTINDFHIDEFAFEGCSKLQSVQLYNVDTIGNGAFKDCTKINTLFIDGELPKISSAFTGAIVKTALCTFSNNYPEYGWPNAQWIKYPLRTVFNYVKTDNASKDGISGNFAHCHKDDDYVTILDIWATEQDSTIRINSEWDNKPVKRICSYANEGVYNNIIIPSSITYIDKYAFYQDEPFTYPQNYLYLYCEPTSRPETWDKEFYHNVSGVYWYSETAITDGQHWHYVGNIPTVWL